MKVNLKNIHNHTLQEIFDYSSNHLLTQNVKAKNREASMGCLYRTDTGLSCAVGCMIADEDYLFKMEGRTVVGVLPLLINYRCIPNKDEYNIKIRLLQSLQYVHDRTNPIEWKYMLKEVATKFELTTNFK